MKILVIHNRYQHRGGEDVACEAETRLLQTAGHAVIQYVRSNTELNDGSFLHYLSAAAGTVWSRHSYRELRELLFREKPDIAHFHNTFPLISPSAYYACADAGVPVVQTLHNYRLICPNAYFLRNGRVCQQCLGRTVPWPGVLHACYRQSRPASAVVATMLAAHHIFQTWQNQVAAYIALTEFARQKFIAGGLPAEKVFVKPNFVERDPGPQPQQISGDYALYVGRLSDEKGIRPLLAAWAQLRQEIPLKIAGDGPLREELALELSRVSAARAVRWLGAVPQSEILGLMRGARFLVVPSICFENFPLAIAEAFASALPVIASRLGAMAEIVADGETGLHFAPGDPNDLAAKAEWAWTHPGEMAAMGLRARAVFEEKYSPASALGNLESIYGCALRRYSQPSPQSSHRPEPPLMPTQHEKAR